MVAERLKRLRERIQQRETSTRADRRAKSRRIERGEPQGAGETATVRARQARESAEMTAEEARGLASDAKQLISTELGVSESESESIISQGAGLLDDVGENLSQLDFDGDGDTDILSGVDPIEPDGGGGTEEPVGGMSAGETLDPTEPVYDPFEDDEPGF